MPMSDQELKAKLQQIKLKCDELLSTKDFEKLPKSSRANTMRIVLDENLQLVNALQKEFHQDLMPECYRYNTKGKTDKSEKLYIEFNKLFEKTQKHLLDLTNKQYKLIASKQAKEQKKAKNDSRKSNQSPQVEKSNPPKNTKARKDKNRISNEELLDRLKAIKKACDEIQKANNVSDLSKMSRNNQPNKVFEENLQKLKSLQDEFNQKLLPECYRFNKDGFAENPKKLYGEYNKLFKKTRKHLNDLENKMYKANAKKQSQSKNVKAPSMSIFQRSKYRAHKHNLDKFSKLLLDASNKYKISPRQHSKEGTSSFQQAFNEKSMKELVKLKKIIQNDIKNIENANKFESWQAVDDAHFQKQAATARQAHAVIVSDLTKILSILDHTITQKSQPASENDIAKSMEAFMEYTDSILDKINEASSTNEVRVLEGGYKIKCDMMRSQFKGTQPNKKCQDAIDVCQDRVATARGDRLLAINANIDDSPSPSPNTQGRFPSR